MICTLCPRRCGAERTEREGRGFCRMPATPVVARAALHPWEEPVLCGPRGAGTVFFSGCNLGCSYCQNAPISRDNFGRPVSASRLREIFEELIARGAATIDLVTPTHFVPFILPALDPPLPVPVVYNCGGYESVETLKLLDGKVQVYLPDLKYADADLARELSCAPDYFSVATAAIREMFRQTGPYVMEKGLPPRGGAGVADEPVYAPARGPGKPGPSCHGGGVSGGGPLHGKLRHHGRLHPGAHLRPGGIHTTL